MVVNAAACLIVRKQKFVSISSTIRDVLHWMPIQQRIHDCAYWCPTVFTTSHPSTCRPCANQSPRISADAVAFGCTWMSGCSYHKDGALWYVQLHCCWTVYTELFAGVTARPVINPTTLLPPTQDLSFRQSVCFIIMLVTVFSLLERANITVPHKHTYNRYGQSTDRMTYGRTDGWTDDLPWQYRAIGNVAW